MKVHPVSFDNTAVAFAHKSNKELKEAYRLFSMMQHTGLVTMGTKLVPWMIKSGLPVEGILRNTIFKQFVGGETLEQTALVAKRLALSKVQVILDYGVEGKEGEASFQHTCHQFIKVIYHAASSSTIPFISIKITGFARFALLEKLDAAMHAAKEPTLLNKYRAAVRQLPAQEVKEWQRVEERMHRICTAAQDLRIGVLVDAEESWIQDPVDALTVVMMQTFNHNSPIVYNTVQLYRHDRLEFLKMMYRMAREDEFLLGVKLVRGAYMEKERKRAKEKKYDSPIQADKPSTDEDYDGAVQFCLEHLDQVGLIVATHNEESHLLALAFMQQQSLPMNHPRIHFSQLYGMSDHITFNLAKAGCNVSKYVPFGPIKEVVPYLLRRAQENTSVKGQTNRELELLQQELKRRGI